MVLGVRSPGLLSPPAQLHLRAHGNDERYDTWSALLDASDEWSEAEATFTRPENVAAAFLLHDLGDVELSEPIELDVYGTLPELNYLDRYAGKAKQQALFESVGYGLEDSGPSSPSAATPARRPTAG